MGYVLKTKDGQYITRPITHPATDEQVSAQLKSLSESGELNLDSSLLASNWAKSIQTEVFGDESLGDVPVAWEIGQIDNNTGAATGDSQKMRIRCTKIVALQPVLVTFFNTSKYKYARYFYDEDGNYIKCDSGWQSGASFTIERGTSLMMKVRENNYAVWTDENIEAFKQTVSFTYQPQMGISQRVDSAEETVATFQQKSKIIDTHTIEISTMRAAIENLSKQNANVLVSCEDDFFPNTEFGEISWETGLDSGSSTYYLRSIGYRDVDTAKGYFAVSTDDSNTIVSIYQYSKDSDGNYQFISSCDWRYDGGTVKCEKGYSYRMLAHNPNGITAGSVKVALTSDIISSIIDAIAGPGSNLLNDELTAADILEYEKTIETIRGITESHPNSAVICFPTDLHLTVSSNVDTCYNNNKYLRTMLTRYNKIVDAVDVDLTVFGGDYLCNSSSTDKNTAIATLKTLKKMIDMLSPITPIAVVKGNHDDNSMYTDYVNGFVNDAERWAALLCKDASKTNRNADHIQYGYGYYDIPNRKIRVFFVNTCDIPSLLDKENNTLSYPGINLAGLQNQQLNYIANHLYFDEEGWQVILFSHHDPYKFIKSAYGGKMLMDILEAFTTKNSGTIVNEQKDFESSVTFDYSANKSNTIIAFISGHTHYDTRRVVNGIQYISLVATSGGLGNYFYSETKAGRYVNYIVIDRESRKLTFIKDGTDPDSPYNSDSTMDVSGDWEVNY